jgi:hypothetical protein
MESTNPSCSKPYVILEHLKPIRHQVKHLPNIADVLFQVALIFSALFSQPSPCGWIITITSEEQVSRYLSTGQANFHIPYHHHPPFLRFTSHKLLSSTCCLHSTTWKLLHPHLRPHNYRFTS